VGRYKAKMKKRGRQEKVFESRRGLEDEKSSKKNRAVSGFVSASGFEQDGREKRFRRLLIVFSPVRAG